jgi:EAL domain-containing protein (putative c-di-GMP-specific phosphodiesterase class I)
MQTQPTYDRITAHPRLERYLGQGGLPEQTPLESLPFTIGRNESVDLQINSSRVSREHALIVKEGGRFRIEDLGSTNGTFVNGRRVEKATLEDGDVLLIADAEFTFFLGKREDTRKTVTEVIDFEEAGPRDDDAPVDLILAVRRAGEALTQRSIFNRFGPIVGLDDGTVLGYEALREHDDPCGRRQAERMLLGVECRLTERMRYVQRLLAVEEASTLAGETTLFLKLHASEIGDAGLPDTLARLRTGLSDHQRLAVEVPEGPFSDTPCFREFHLRLQELGVGLAYDGFAAGKTQLMQLKEIRPDFLKLAPPLVRRIHTNRERQRRLKSLIRASGELGCEVVATGVEEEDEAAMCREFGCGFGQGPYFGGPQPASGFRHRGKNQHHGKSERHSKDEHYSKNEGEPERDRGTSRYGPSH